MKIQKLIPKQGITELRKYRKITVSIDYKLTEIARIWKTTKVDEN